MLRVIFDTNIYGHLIAEPDAAELEERIVSESEFTVYGFIPIRKEIRNIPKTTKLSRQTRIVLLKAYDKITGNHLLSNSAKITHIAKKYYDFYRQSGGGYTWDTTIRIDFMIVACASVHGLDIVYSNDNKTLSNKTAIKSYDHINMKENIRTPRFLNYDELLKKFRGLP